MLKRAPARQHVVAHLRALERAGVDRLQNFAGVTGRGEAEDADGVAFAAIQGLNRKLEASNAVIKKENAEHWIDRDPELKCYLPGVPRAMYMPYPFEITQSTNKIHVAYEFSNTARTIHLDKVEGPPDDAWMGHSVGRWEGNTLVVEVTNFNDRTWFDRAGNYHSDALHLTERFTQMSPDVILYEVTIEDPKVYTRPWRISMPLYRRMEPNMQLLEFRCNEFAEEFMYGNLRKQPLVRHWEGDTMTVDITRKVPPGDLFYQWYGR